MTAEQTLAFKSVSEWVFLEQHQASSAAASDDFGVSLVQKSIANKLLFELHSHSNCSDGFLSPSKLVERAHENGIMTQCLASPRP